MSDLETRCLEDLVRLDAGVGRALERLDGRLEEVPEDGGWTPAEHLLHVVLTLELVAAEFRGLRAGPPPGPPPASLKKSAARVLVLTTFRIPSGAPAPAAVKPSVLLSREELAARSRAARDELVALVDMADRPREEAWIEHFALGPMSFAEWVRFLLIHGLHHFRILRKRFR